MKRAGQRGIGKRGSMGLTRRGVWETLRNAYMDPALTSEHEGMVIYDGCPRCRAERRLAPEEWEA